MRKKGLKLNKVSSTHKLGDHLRDRLTLDATAPDVATVVLCVDSSLTALVETPATAKFTATAGTGSFWIALASRAG